MGRGPTRYGGVTDAQLAAALAAWFDRHAGRRDIWNRSEVGRLLKARLIQLGAFKNKPRGDPAKGRAAMLERLAERDAPAPELPEPPSSPNLS
jgi:hypothetical protein